METPMHPEEQPDFEQPTGEEKVNVVLAYTSNFVEHGDADAYNEPPAKVDPVDPGFNPDPAPKHHVGSHDPVIGKTHLNGDEAGGI